MSEVNTAVHLQVWFLIPSSDKYETNLNFNGHFCRQNHSLRILINKIQLRVFSLTLDPMTMWRCQDFSLISVAWSHIFLWVTNFLLHSLTLQFSEARSTLWNNHKRIFFQAKPLSHIQISLNIHGEWTQTPWLPKSKDDQVPYCQLSLSADMEAGQGSLDALSSWKTLSRGGGCLEVSSWNL